MPQDPQRRRLEQLSKQSEKARAETITVEEAAQYLGKTISSTYRAIHRGDLPSVRDGRRLRVPVAAVISTLEKMTAQLDSRGRRVKA